MKTPAQQPELVGQQQALESYFDALFNHPAPVALEVSPPVEEPLQAAAIADPPQAEPDPLQVQLFRVAGLTFALPRQRIASILETPAGFSPLADPAAPILGTVDVDDGGQARVVDTAQLVIPAARPAQSGADMRVRCRHLLLIDAGRWALACEELAEVVVLSEAEVTWRTAAGTRPWLAGMAAARRCALLDADGLLRLLEDCVA